MIGKLKGIIDEKDGDRLTLDVGGVGYDVFCAERTLATLPPKGDTAVLWIETIVREDFIKLYGFASVNERAWFRLLTTVQGVGAKVALAILSTLRPAELERAIAAQDKTSVGRASGVGPKLAARIVQELKGKSPVDLADFGKPGSDIIDFENAALRDAVSALVNLGYAPMQASEVAAKLMQQGAANDAAGLIRGALKELAQR
ncbi:MAG: Holliday junction branch migration protein RuvA [Pseudomonadota bacterium]